MFGRFPAPPAWGDGAGRRRGARDAGTQAAEFRRRAVELARLRNKPADQAAKDLGIAESCLHNGMARTGVGEGWSASSLGS